MEQVRVHAAGAAQQPGGRGDRPPEPGGQRPVLAHVTHQPGQQPAQVTAAGPRAPALALVTPLLGYASVMLTTELYWKASVLDLLLQLDYRSV